MKCTLFGGPQVWFPNTDGIQAQVCLSKKTCLGSNTCGKTGTFIMIYNDNDIYYKFKFNL